MGIKVKEVTPEKIEELRERFKAKYATTPPAAPFHPVDIDRIRNDHVWLQRFLEMYDLDMEVSMTKLWETCAWRQSYGANDLDESKLNQEYLKEGSVFVHSNDVDGKPLLVFRVRLHSKSKSLDELIRIVVYWVERTQREKHMTQMTIFFDMAGTGLATMDLDFVKKIVETFKMYYPNALNYILVFELAWVLNAAFKVIKALLPPKAVEILKMISKKDIGQYILKDSCLASWGGSDNYEYSFVAETKRVEASKPVTSTDDDQLVLGGDKKVHFANTAPMVLKESNIGDMHTPTESMLQLEQKEFVNFDPKNAEATVHFKSIAKVPVTFKIQTTSPEKFRVRPRCGIISPNEKAEISIWLKSEYKLRGDSKDKFLVMAMLAPGHCAGADVTDLWRNACTDGPDVEQHRLVCRFEDMTAKCCDKIASETSLGCGKDGKLDLQAQVKSLSRSVNNGNRIQYLNLLLLLGLSAAVGFLYYVHYYPGAGSGQSAAFCSAKRK
ncbi:blast:Motile sperm domain-containing protein 2 [Drosophila guanche]|uniref:Blast:Motile sperm domain-containing protein 2 n=3 Tax=Drosophila guanche TaxID=7266 RepID=A0A3B0JBU2_DROGU|nr:blast:Motile sperm domain-containing protein 2 [Drosophila guanche]